MVKRSPILGYNHNVRYRGLVFHVQTEDSGVLSPHLFTHLFYGGTIISTRKLVYDAGSAEDAIKALMQAQHKAVMKDLKNGSFDEKIDQYLGGVAGLEPRGTKPNAIPRASNAELTPVPEATERAITEVDSAPIRASTDDDRTTPIDLTLQPASGTAPTIDINAITPPTIEIPRGPADTEPVLKPRTKTADRGSKGGQVRFKQMEPPLPEDEDPPTIPKDVGIAEAVRAANRVGSSGKAVPPPIPGKASRDSAPEISIEMEAEESARFRTPRDTVTENPFEGLSLESDGIPRSPDRSRSASQNAATLPPAKKPSRPAIAPPAVRSRPITNSDDKSGAVEIYAPAPASVDPPPGERAERPGQYSVSRRNSEAPIREKTGRIAAVSKDPVPAGLERPRTPSGQAPPLARPPTGAPPRVPQPTRGVESGNAIPQVNRSPHVTAPISSRTASPSASGVVMTRPAVIVGAPAKAATQTPTRVRKAREDEGRGFGQGLISEKSLDEVILAYLSEDGDDK